MILLSLGWTACALRLQFSPPVQLTAVGTYMTGGQGVDDEHAFIHATSGWTATRNGGKSWSTIAWSNRSSVSSSADPSLQCVGWPPGGQGTDEQRCTFGNTLGDGYLYVFNAGRGTSSAACGEAAHCFCCRCREDATHAKCAPKPLAPSQSSAAGVLLPRGVLRSVDVDVADKDANYTSLSSTMSTTFFWDAHSETWAFNTSTHLPTTFSGIPAPGVSCGNAKHAFGCPFRLSGRGYVRLHDGTLVMSVIVWAKQWANPDPKLEEEATSIVAFRSYNDGLDWTYAGLIVAARDAPSSEEGPNENDIVLAGDGKTILCVFRMDAGDGPLTHRYAPYALSSSIDGGTTWTRGVSLGDGVGCARPRLLRSTSGAVVLAGGRTYSGNHDTILWLHASATRASAYAANGTWVAHSVSYWHNALEANKSLHFSPEVNGSGGGSFRQTTSYTSLIKVGSGGSEGLVTYARHLPPYPDVAFSMSFVVEE